MSKAVDRWQGGERHREPFIQRAIEAASLSQPQLAPRWNGEIPTGDLFPRRFSSLAAKGVSNLSSKLTSTLFPTQRPFFRLAPDLRVFAELGGQADQIDDLMVALSRRERAIDAFLDDKGFRAMGFWMFQNILVAGNFLLRQAPSGRFIGYRLDRFQVERDGLDRPKSILLKETVSKAALIGAGVKPESVQALDDLQGYYKDSAVLYTVADVVEDSLDDTKERKWSIHQELSTGEWVGKEKILKDSTLPLVPVRLFQSDEHYGRSLFDLIQGEVETVEGLTQALVEDAAMSALGLWGIDPASGVDLDEFLSKGSGEGVYARADQIQMIRANKGGDLSVASALLQSTTRDLNNIFLNFSPRNAERVTAAEIVQIAKELNEALGGAFSLLGQEMQIPIVKLTEQRMIALGELPKLDDERLVQPKIVSGVDAIGRGREEQALESYILTVQQAIGPDAAAQRFKTGNLLSRLAAAKGIDPENLVKTDEEVAAEQQAQQQNQAALAAVPEAVRIAGQNSQQTQP